MIRRLVLSQPAPSVWFAGLVGAAPAVFVNSVVRDHQLVVRLLPADCFGPNHTHVRCRFDPLQEGVACAALTSQVAKSRSIDSSSTALGADPRPHHRHHAEYRYVLPRAFQPVPLPPRWERDATGDHWVLVLAHDQLSPVVVEFDA